MTNEEITAYMFEWRNSMKSAPNKESTILGATIGIVVLLAEIAKRLPMEEKK